jgi:hypothetical protein
VILTTATPPACYATVNAFYADPNNRERGGIHVRVFVVGDYAAAAWYGANTGGQGVFRRRHGSWCKIVNGGGVMGVGGMVEFGVPRAIAVKLNAKINRGA